MNGRNNCRAAPPPHCCIICKRKVTRRGGCFYRAATWKIRLEIAGTFESESTL
jgi:hypothetical protein